MRRAGDGRLDVSHKGMAGVYGAGVDRHDAIGRAWSRVAAEIGTDVDRARVSAERALDLSGRDHRAWQVYRRAMSLCGADFRLCPQLPPEWMFHYDTGRWHQLVLIHPSVAEMVTRTWALDVFLVAAKEAGSGLLRLDGLLAQVLFHALEAPDDASTVR